MIVLIVKTVHTVTAAQIVKIAIFSHFAIIAVIAIIASIVTAATIPLSCLVVKTVTLLILPSMSAETNSFIWRPLNKKNTS